MSRVGALRSLVGVTLSSSVLLATGCLDQLEKGGATVFVFSTHHATPVDGVFPIRGDDKAPRVFDNDQGWTVTLLESYITTSAVTLVRCDGEPIDLNMFWGPCPENLSDKDLDSLTVAGIKVGPGDFCGLEVSYGPYMTPVIDDSEVESTRHQTPENGDVTGATVYLRGAARMGDGESVQFELRASGDLDVDLDLSDLEGDGNPMTVDRQEDFPRELTVSKTYDRFFDGVDFATFDPEALEAELLDILEAETRISDGPRVLADDADE
jgi:hypothetical protein